MTGRLWRGSMVFCGLMILWGLASRSGIPHFLLPSPMAVAEALWVNCAYLGWNTLITLSEILSGLALVDDYGHHPTEVDATIKAARAGWPDKNLVMLFQPHRFTRTRDLYDDFANVLTQVDTLLMLEVYPAGEAPIPGADSRSLCRTIRGRGKIDPILVPDPAQVAEMLAPVLTGNDLILVQGAGNIGKIARSLAEIKLKPQTPEEEQHD